MGGRVKVLTRYLREYDSCLFAQMTHPPRIDICRKSQYGGHPPNLVFSLTEDWSVRTPPVEWGIEVVMNRVKAHDIWRDDSFVENFIADYEKQDASNERALKNSIEGFVREFRRPFAKATDSVNTSNLKKLYRKEK